MSVLRASGQRHSFQDCELSVPASHTCAITLKVQSSDLDNPSPTYDPCAVAETTPRARWRSWPLRTIWRRSTRPFSAWDGCAFLARSWAKVVCCRDHSFGGQVATVAPGRPRACGSFHVQMTT